MRLIDEQFTQTPFYGVRKMTAWLRLVKKYDVNPKRVRRLMRLMGLETIYQKPRLSTPAPGHQIYPYLWMVAVALWIIFSWSASGAA
jgi:putative transposase